MSREEMQALRRSCTALQRVPGTRLAGCLTFSPAGGYSDTLHGSVFVLFVAHPRRRKHPSSPQSRLWMGSCTTPRWRCQPGGRRSRRPKKTKKKKEKTERKRTLKTVELHVLRTSQKELRGNRRVMMSSGLRTILFTVLACSTHASQHSWRRPIARSFKKAVSTSENRNRYTLCFAIGKSTNSSAHTTQQKRCDEK